MEDIHIQRLKRRWLENPENPQTRMAYLLATFRGGRRLEAQNIVIEALKRDPRDHTLRRLLYEQSGQVYGRGSWPLHDGLGRARASSAQGARMGQVSQRLRLGVGGSSRFRAAGGGAEFGVSLTVSEDGQVYLTTDRDRMLVYDSENWQRKYSLELDGPLYAPCMGPAWTYLLTRRRLLSFRGSKDPKDWHETQLNPRENRRMKRRLGLALELSASGHAVLFCDDGWQWFELGAFENTQTLPWPGRSPISALMVGDLLYVLENRNSLKVYDPTATLLQEFSWDRERIPTSRARLMYDASARCLLITQSHRSFAAPALTLSIALDNHGRPSQDQVELLGSFELLAIHSNGDRLVQAPERGYCHWQQAEGQFPVAETQHLAVDGTGMLYLWSGEALHCYAPGGFEMFRVDAPAPVSVGPVIGPGGTVLIGFVNGLIFVIE